MITRRQFFKFSMAAGMGAFLASRTQWMKTAQASYQLAQTPLAGSLIPRFVEPLPTFVGLRQSGTEIPVEMLEFQQMVLPASFYAPLAAPFNSGTYVWGYNVNNTLPIYPGVTVESLRGTPQRMRYINNLPVSGSEVQKRVSVDQTLHWADPLGEMCHMSGGMPMNNCLLPYEGPPPAVVHLHGGEVPSEFDGGPDQWYTPDGLYHGQSFRTLDPDLLNGALYEYPNLQEASTLWFHDHALGATRTNVYSGMAAFYLLRDAWDTGGADNGPGLPWGNYEVEIALQDRMFDTNGQLYFPDIGLNPEHPLWLPEFFGDVVVVNGKTWPF
ncbi:bilirubin oxidase, partial [bacterium]